jgi:hypothetical protein
MDVEAAEQESKVARTIAKRDYLFTWKDHPEWSLADLRALAEKFSRDAHADEWWRCNASRKIRPGDNAYLLKQGKPVIGIFGRGFVGDVDVEREKALISFRKGDVLWDPGDHFDNFLVSQEQLFGLPVPRSQWQLPAAGNELPFSAARQIDNIIADSLRVGGTEPDSVDEAAREIARLKRMAEQWIRPEQREFRNKIRICFQDRCAVTGCTTADVLEAAHISTKNGFDDNSESNGILLRSDIHLLFDRLLITLSEDGTKIEVSPELTDQGYLFLRDAEVARSVEGPLSKEKIREHRNLFFERQRLRSRKG